VNGKDNLKETGRQVVSNDFEQILRNIEELKRAYRMIKDLFKGDDVSETQILSARHNNSTTNASGNSSESQQRPKPIPQNPHA